MYIRRPLFELRAAPNKPMRAGGKGEPHLLIAPIA
jgi:hypothetical protein